MPARQICLDVSDSSVDLDAVAFAWALYGGTLEGERKAESM